MKDGFRIDLFVAAIVFAAAFWTTWRSTGGACTVLLWFYLVGGAQIATLQLIQLDGHQGGLLNAWLNKLVLWLNCASLGLAALRLSCNITFQFGVL